MGAYGQEYRRAVATLIRKRGNTDKVLQDAVGGYFDEVGPHMRKVLLEEGLPEDGLLVDIGCGIGRLAVVMADLPNLRYIGFDVVPELLASARERVTRPDWTFAIVDKAMIPSADASVDMIACFSVFTHLPKRESLNYLREAYRALKPGGKIAFSFLDPAVDFHKVTLSPWPMSLLLKMRGWARNVGNTPDEVRAWADAVGFKVTRLESPSIVGQSLAVFQKKAA